MIPPVGVTGLAQPGQLQIEREAESSWKFSNIRGILRKRCGYEGIP
jgi:hypothetical protein